MAILVANGFRTPTCSLSPYRPRGDLSVFVEQRRASLYPLITAVACDAGVPAGLLDALIAQESHYDPAIVSAKGVVGLTQLMPGTAAYLGVVDARDPLQNQRGGARYLRAHLDEFGRSTSRSPPLMPVRGGLALAVAYRLSRKLSVMWPQCCAAGAPLRSDRRSVGRRSA